MCENPMKTSIVLAMIICLIFMNKKTCLPACWRVVVGVEEAKSFSNLGYVLHFIVRSGY